MSAFSHSQLNKKQMNVRWSEFFFCTDRQKEKKVHGETGWWPTLTLLLICSPFSTDFVCTEQLRCNSGAAISGHESIVVTCQVLAFFVLGGSYFLAEAEFLLWISIVPSWNFLYKKDLYQKRISWDPIQKKDGVWLCFSHGSVGSLDHLIFWGAAS